MKDLVARLIVLGSFAVAVSANAIVINRDFDIAFSSGPLASQSYAGSLSYEDANLTGSGHEVMAPSAALGTVAGFLSLEVTIDGTAFTLADDASYSVFPRLGFINGVLTMFDYRALVGGNQLNIFGAFPANVFYTPGGVALTAPTTQQSSGTLTLRPPSTGVPEGGSTLLLLGVAMVGLGAVRRFRVGA